MILNFSILIIASVFWGIGFLFVKIGERSITPITEMAVRSVIALVTLLLICLFTKRSLSSTTGKYRAFIMFGILGITIPWIGVAYSEKSITSGLTASMLSTIPIFTFIITSLIIKSERFTIYGFTGLIISLVGIILVIGIESIFKQNSTFIGILLVLGAFFCYAVNGILVPIYAKEVDALITITYTIGFALILLTVLAFTLESPVSIEFSTENLLALLGLGVISTALMFLSYYILLKRAGALFTSLLGYLAPISGIVAGVIFLNEKIGTMQILGIFLVLLGVFLVSLPKLRANN